MNAKASLVIDRARGPEGMPVVFVSPNGSRRSV
jgi:hypothetical protein